MRILLMTKPPIWPSPVAWNFNVVFAQLLKPHFEPLANSSLKLFNWKVTFLIAITSARQVNELQALVAHPPYTRFHHDRVALRTYLHFLPKDVTPFHFNQSIVLLTIFVQATCTSD